jgi:hypothetical protein
VRHRWRPVRRAVNGRSSTTPITTTTTAIIDTRTIPSDGDNNGNRKIFFVCNQNLNKTKATRRAAQGAPKKKRKKTTYLPTTYRGASKKKQKKTSTKKRIKNLAKSDRPTFFFLGAPFKRYARRLWTCHRRWAPAAGCGVFLCELVPSGDPFI